MDDLQSSIQVLDKLLMSFYHNYVNIYAGLVVDRKIDMKKHVIRKLMDVKRQYDDYLFLYVGRYDKDLHYKEKIKPLLQIVETFNQYNILYIMRYTMELIHGNDSMRVASLMIEVDSAVSKIKQISMDINFIY